MIHIRTCSDSANALIELLKYVITDGDLQQQQAQQQTNEISRSSTPIERKRSDRPVRMISDETLNNEQLATDNVSSSSFHILSPIRAFRRRIKWHYLKKQ